MTPTDRRLRALGVALFVAAFLVALTGTQAAGGTALGAAALGISAIVSLAKSGALSK